MASKRLRTGGRVSSRSKYWDSLPWKAIDTTKENLGDFEESVFFGLEELDGNAFLLNKNKEGYVPVVADDVENEGVSDGGVIVKEKKVKKKAKRSKLESDLTTNDQPLENAAPSVTSQVINIVDVIPESASTDTDDKAVVPTDGKKPKRVLTVEQKIEKYRLIAERKLKFKKAKENKEGVTTVVTNNKVTGSLSQGKPVLDDSSDWGGIKINQLLYNSLIKLSFSSPTPIQLAAIPRILAGGSDIVGAAETGSGKTLAFGLPIIHSLMMNWETYSNVHTPYALIIAPTRELAMQITTVLKDVCLDFKQQFRIEVVTIVGGMSEQKQRRQLAANNKPLHIVVATPGRLVEIFSDETVEAFQDMSKLKFLVVDEADRIMEEGHFAELHRVFSRICDHEKLAQAGEDPVEVARRAKQGSSGGMESDIPTAEHNEETVEFDAMPSEEDMRRARAQPAQKNTGSDGEEDGEEGDEEVAMDIVTPEPEDRDEEEGVIDISAADTVVDYAKKDRESKRNKKNKNKPVAAAGVLNRQTLLFSATAVQAPLIKSAANSKKDKLTKLNGTLMGIGQNGTLPEHLKKLLSMIAVQKVIHAIDVTAGNLARRSKTATAAGATETKGKDGKKKSTEEDEEELDNDDFLNDADTIITLPKGLSQFEIRVPTEEKDVFAYYYLLKHPGRSLLFVNSIKTARRVDGLLRALGINCRTIHAQLQQRQRLRALESFRSSPIGVLVATDVAARGLDIPKIQSVIHYDIARSPQVYIHRSGRTARANSTGTSVSLPSPEDASHHKAICDYLGMVNGALPLLNVELACLPILRERVKLAKKIFTQSFVASQSSKEKHWLQQNATQADLQIDEYMQNELGDEDTQKAKEVMSKKALDKAKYQLKVLLDTPLEDSVSKKGHGFFVYAK